MRLRPRAMTPAPDFFENIHAHGITGSRVLTSVSPGYKISTTPGEAWYSAGIHPWDTAAVAAEADWQALETLAADPRVAAIGECGLDALRGGSQEVQEKIFRRQADLAERVGKFMIIHCVRRYGLLMELHRELRPSQPWIVHGFRGKPELARQLLREGIQISLPPDSPLRPLFPGAYHETD